MKQIHYILFLICILNAVSGIANAQVAFIRIYDHHNKKIGKGIVELIADTVIVISNDKKGMQRVLITEISFIKTKKSFGAYVGTGTGVAVAVSAIVGLTALKFTDPNEVDWCAIGIGTLSTVAVGTVAGVISGIATKRQKFIINGDVEKWKEVATQWFGYHQPDNSD